MFIQTEQTPEPGDPEVPARREVMAARRGRLHRSGAMPQPSPLARRLFEVEGVTGVFFGVGLHHRHQGRGPGLARAQARRARRDHGALPVGRPGRGAARPRSTTTARRRRGRRDRRQIQELIETRVRPAVAQDGGDIIFRGFERGVVYLHMRGACSGCPSSTITLKNGIENLLRYYVPEVVEVRPVS